MWSISCSSASAIRLFLPDPHLTAGRRVDALGDDFRGAHEFAAEARHGKAALVEPPFAGSLDDLRVYERDRRIGLIVDVDHHHPQANTDLRRRETHAGSVVHRLPHVLDEAGGSNCRFCGPASPFPAARDGRHAVWVRIAKTLRPPAKVASGTPEGSLPPRETPLRGAGNRLSVRHTLSRMAPPRAKLRRPIVVGSGISGLFVALEARHLGPVLVLTKGSIDDCNTALGTGRHRRRRRPSRLARAAPGRHHRCRRGSRRRSRRPRALQRSPGTHP